MAREEAISFGIDINNLSNYYYLRIQLGFFKKFDINSSS